MPAERTSRHTDTGQVAMPRSASSATSAFSVRSGTAFSRSITSARCGSSNRFLCPPIGRAAALPVARWRCDHFTTLTPDSVATLGEAAS